MRLLRIASAVPSHAPTCRWKSRSAVRASQRYRSTAVRLSRMIWYLVFWYASRPCGCYALGPTSCVHSVGKNAFPSSMGVIDRLQQPSASDNAANAASDVANAAAAVLARMPKEAAKEDVVIQPVGENDSTDLQPVRLPVQMDEAELEHLSKMIDFREYATGIAPLTLRPPVSTHPERRSE